MRRSFMSSRSSGVWMDIAELYGFVGRRVLVVGGATGMGAAATSIVRDLGGEVTVFDYATVTESGVQGVMLDLRDESSINQAVDSCDGPFDAVLSCAGVASGAPGIHQVNFIGQRHLLERLLDQGKLPAGSSIAMISSVAGLGWEANLPTLLEYLATPDYDSAVAWIEQHPEQAGGTDMQADYSFSKRAVCAYVASRSFSFLRQGVRINAVLPGVVDTQLAKANNWFASDETWRNAVGVERATPEGPALPLVFLCSKAAGHINGAMLTADAGWIAAQMTGALSAAGTA
jgi:NAD(P)-dependent dehydrogenase (short-subunit alcohol dehydrogenase family)